MTSTTDQAMRPLQSDLTSTPVEWERSIQEMLSTFPASVTVRRQPSGCLHVIPRFFRLSEDVSIVAEIEYGKNGVDFVRLAPVIEHRVADWSTERVLVANAVAHRLGLPLARYQDATWQTPEFDVEFQVDWDDFHFVIRKRR